MKLQKLKELNYGPLVLILIFAYPVFGIVQLAYLNIIHGGNRISFTCVQHKGKYYIADDTYYYSSPPRYYWHVYKGQGMSASNDYSEKYIGTYYPDQVKAKEGDFVCP